MLTLPRLDGQADITKKNKEPVVQEGTIFECIHLGSTYSHEVKDIQTLRKQRFYSSQAAGEAREGSGDGSLVRAASAGSPTRKASGHLGTPRMRSNNQFCGLVTASLSHAGSWLDSRPFADRRCETSHNQKRRHGGGGRSRKDGEISEGERFVLKRCKDILLRRYGSLNVAFKRLDGNGSNILSPMEFMDATSSLFKRSEAQILYRCLDRNGDHSVSMDELLSQLEDI
eukprot:gnl/MRDRNA2_/MRDRNA2_126341_c0_seq1.p1 gnl/MRDRNA2_/MRDRNA2_126341_c0~~gnl/MRDRNA2_/MRDRNA2_126341_c0_seq1.p1  ORF type:complete len:242 (+),score=48.08 gnl/MRDRNA2_/MRDRNA2_126341_c0_seq1:45-728(+)